jgi:hypothetical protein
VVAICTIRFNTPELPILPTQCICVVRTVLTATLSPNSITSWALQWRLYMLPVRYELNYYILLKENQSMYAHPEVMQGLVLILTYIKNCNNKL